MAKSAKPKKAEISYKLPPDWRDSAIAVLNKKVPGLGVCQVCKKATTHASSNVVSPVSLDENYGFDLKETAYPQMLLICSYCGFTRHFNFLLLMSGEADDDAAS